MIYPVVTMALPGTHAVSRELLLGPNPSPTQIARRSAQLHVGADTPPLFLVHALDDAAVPVTNSLDLLAVMRAANRPWKRSLLRELDFRAFGDARSARRAECRRLLNACRSRPRMPKHAR